MSTEKTPLEGAVPPYLTISKLDRVLELARSRNLNEVSKKLFMTYGFSAADAGLAVSLLRFLKAIDESGKATAAMEGLRLESADRRRTAFEPLVRAAYAKLFAAVTDPYALPKSDLADEFKVQYGVSSRVVAGALPVFLKLSEYAGLVEPGTVIGRTLGPRVKRMDKSTGSPERSRISSRGSASSEDSHVQQILKNQMTISIPEAVFIRMGTDDEMNDSWRLVLKAAHAFAARYIDKEEKSDAESGESG